MTIERKEVGDQAVLVVAGRMDAESAPQFQHECDAWIADGVTNLVVDLSQLTYISSMGLRCFVALAKTLQEKGGVLRICRLQGLVNQVFEITGFKRTFLIYESLDSALLGGQP